VKRTIGLNRSWVSPLCRGRDGAEDVVWLWGGKGGPIRVSACASPTGDSDTGGRETTGTNAVGAAVKEWLVAEMVVDGTSAVRLVEDNPRGGRAARSAASALSALASAATTLS